MRTILPSNPALRYMGRIDNRNPDRPVWIYPYTQVSFRFSGTSLYVTIVNHKEYGDSQLGFILDGMQGKIRIPSDNCQTVLQVAGALPDIEHEITLFKRQDGEHYLDLVSMSIDDGSTICAPITSKASRRIEVFGDSVSCGERNEAVLYTGKPDPDVDLSSYSNSWFSYAAITARNFNAQLHDVSQGGIALLDGIGWFHAPAYIGMESMWNRLEYNPALGDPVKWDFKRYTPHVVIVAIGQNDAHPHDFMSKNYTSQSSLRWRNAYFEFIQNIRNQYPKALIVLSTTILQHDPSWDRAIGDVCSSLSDPKIVHFEYIRNGSATPGHPRISEHEEMAKELTEFLETFGESIWID